MAARSSTTKIKRTEHGTYEWVAWVTDQGGNRRQVRKRFATLREARERLAAITTEVAAGTFVDARGITVGDYMQAWLARKVAAGDLRASTARSYGAHIASYLVPALGRIKIVDLRPGHIDEMLDRIRDGRLGGARPPGPATQRRIVATLASALSDAAQDRMITWNPARHAKVGKGVRPKVSPWSRAEVERFLAATAAERDAALWWTAIFTGLRRGELAGLRWADVDAERRVIVVREQAVVVGHEVIYGPPKTAAGDHRLVDLDDATIGVLLEHRLRQDAERAEWGEAWTESGRVFVAEGGAALHPERITRRFRRLTDAHGLRPVRVHDLRHGHASLALAAGVPLAVISKRLGHSSINITADTYSHLLDGVGQAAASAIAGLFVPAEEGAPAEL
jgi:integrase